jgi:hypothetical protein
VVFVQVVASSSRRDPRLVELQTYGEVARAVDEAAAGVAAELVAAGMAWEEVAKLYGDIPAEEAERRLTRRRSGNKGSTGVR